MKPEEKARLLYEEIFCIGRFQRAKVPIDPEAMILRALLTARQEGRKAGLEEAVLAVPSVPESEWGGYGAPSRLAQLHWDQARDAIRKAGEA